MRARLERAFFNRPTLTVARELLGKHLFHVAGDRELGAMITEVEAYKGPRDRAAHTHGGRRTARVEPLYGEGGTAYVYFVYGMHWMLNLSAAGAEIPEGILVRGVLLHADEASDHAHEWIEGPGRVCRRLQVDGSLSGVDTVASHVLWLEDHGHRFPASRILRGPRVGIDYAGPHWAARPWRYRVEKTLALAVLASSRPPRTRR